jgi:SNF2 family DNA or RNA helicase
MPTSLIYNWEAEARKFAPELKVLTYTGTYRDKNIEQFDNYDVILTSYGIVRIDIDILKNYRFHYAILDESQSIKNPSSFITKAVMQLNTRHRLVLTGTPLENSTMDLWSQMTFVNPGLLGTQHFSKTNFKFRLKRKAMNSRYSAFIRLSSPLC